VSAWASAKKALDFWWRKQCIPKIVPGPGCLHGIQECFGLEEVSVEEAQAVIYHFVEEQDEYFKG
jgi:hypothetical protein